METCIKEVQENHDIKKSREYYKKIWLALFEWKTLTSCQDDDSDLFNVSALLKTAFSQFKKLKKRLNDAQNVIVSLRLELKETQMENEKFNQKLNELKSTNCTHCQALIGMQAYSDGHEWEPDYLTSDVKSSKEGFGPMHSISHAKKGEDHDVQETSISTLVTNSVGKILKMNDEHGNESMDDSSNESCLVLKEGYDAEKPSAFTGGEVNDLPTHHEVTLERSNCKTPDKQMAFDECIKKSSPLLNSQKRSKKFKLPSNSPREDPNRTSRHSKSPSFLMSETDSSEKVILCSQTILKPSPKGKGVRLAINPKKKMKFSSLSLKQNQVICNDLAQTALLEKKVSSPMEKLTIADPPKKKAHSPPAAGVKGQMGTRVRSLQQSTPIRSLPGAAGNVGGGDATPATRNEVSPVVLTIPNSTIAKGEEEGEEEDVIIIMPSPNSSQHNNAVVLDDANMPDDTVLPSRDNIPGKGGTNYNRLKNLNGGCQSKKALPPLEVDTDATYFVPLQAEESDGEDEGSGDSSGSESKDNNGGQPHHEPLPSTSRATVGGLRPPRRLLTSFDQVPGKIPKTNFKYQRAALRKKNERMQMEGWECKACEKYYRIAGANVDSPERKQHVNKCSRHRDAFSPRKCTPGGDCEEISSEEDADVSFETICSRSTDDLQPSTPRVSQMPESASVMFDSEGGGDDGKEGEDEVPTQPKMKNLEEISWENKDFVPTIHPFDSSNSVVKAAVIGIWCFLKHLKTDVYLKSMCMSQYRRMKTNEYQLI